MLAALIFVAAVGQSNNRPPIVTDRPNVAESSLTVPDGAVQLETGVEFSGTGSDDEEINTAGFPTKLRYGVTESAELHVEGTVFNRNSVFGETSSGLADLDLGGKIHLLDPSGVIPSLGVLFAVTVPVGADAVSGDQTLLKPTVSAEWSLLPALSLSINLGLTIPVEDRELFDDVLRFAGSFGIQPGFFPEELSLFAELFGETPLGDGEETLASDFGAAWGLTPDVQLDAYVRVGLNDQFPDVVAGGGVSFRI
ncbi:MAG: transporter [Myxococcota bacterium]